jgi:hypothetical protein
MSRILSRLLTFCVVQSKLVIARFQLGFQRWPFKWQLRNLWIWCLVQLAPKKNTSSQTLPALNKNQHARLLLYCQLEPGKVLPTNAITARQITLHKHSHYAGDLLRCLYPHFLDQRFVKEFGDVNWIPDLPTFVKSRPIAPNNHHAVLLPMDVRRHMCFPSDPFTFTGKHARMVWRGAGYQPHRQLFLQQAQQLSCCDAGDPGLPSDHAHYRPWLSVHQQLRFKYIISIEGNDVATNLKWIMHSNSLCVMPKPRFETWFLESRLIPGVHYAEISDDFSNLQEIFEHYEKWPEEALAIIAQAQAYTLQFLDPVSNNRLAQHVCQAYFQAHTHE